MQGFLIPLWFKLYTQSWITGVTFPIRSRLWPERTIWRYIVPVIFIDLFINLPEFYSTIAHLSDLEVRKIIYQYILRCRFFCNFTLLYVFNEFASKVLKFLFLKQLSWYNDWHRFSTVWQSTLIPWVLLLGFNFTTFIVMRKKRPSSLRVPGCSRPTISGTYNMSTSHPTSLT